MRKETVEMRDDDTFKQKLDEAKRRLDSRQSEIASYAVSVQGAITNASVQAMLECKHGASDPRGDHPVESPIAKHLLDLADLGNEVWAAPLKGMAEEAEELDVLLECVSSFRVLLDEESWRKETFQMHAKRLLEAAEGMTGGAE
jgi:hypothetical protein